MTARNYGKVTAGRDGRGRFTTGNSGRPHGARHKTTLAVMALLDGEAEALTRRAVELALGGDVTALRLCLERIAPPRKDAPVTVKLPAMHSAADTVRAAGAVLDAVAAGELTPTEGAHVMALVEAFRRTLEVSELEARLAALEADRGVA
ncbi:MAG: DUF5681 domain-containing protein [Gemmobacter sp.]